MTLLAGHPPGGDDVSALELGAFLARSSSRDLVAVTVVPAGWPTPVAGHTDREFEAWARSQGEAAAEDAARSLAEWADDVVSRSRWVAGRSIPSALLAAAEEEAAEMIVVGASREGAYGRVQVGSTSDHLLHDSAVPVALAPRGFEAPSGATITRVTCAFRGDEASQRTLERTASICTEIGAPLRVATFAVRGRTMYPPEVGIGAEDMVLGGWVEQAGAAQQRAIAGLTDSADVVGEVAVGRSWAAAIDKLGWERTEVLVIGSSQAGRLSRLFLGSNATKIVRHAPVPVIVVP